MIIKKEFSENVEKAYSEVFSDLTAKLNIKKETLNIAEVNKLKWGIEKTYCKTIDTPAYIKKRKEEIAEIEGNIPLLKKDIEKLNERINFFNSYADDIKSL
jgi:hypothetical protein